MTRFAVTLSILLSPSVAWARHNLVPDRAALESPAEVAAATAASCPGDVVAWLDPARGLYYLPQEHAFGTTVRGTYMCRKAADMLGYREGL